MSTGTDPFDDVAQPIAPVAHVKRTTTTSTEPITDRVRREGTATFTREMAAIGKEVDIETLARQTGKHKKKVKVVKESQLRLMIESILERFLQERQITVSEEEKIRLQKEASKDLNHSMKQLQALQEELDEALVAKVDLELALEAEQAQGEEKLQAKTAELAAVVERAGEAHEQSERALAALEEENQSLSAQLDQYAALAPEVASLKTMIGVVGEEAISDAELSAQCRHVEEPEEILVVATKSLDDLRLSLAAAQEGRRSLVEANQNMVREADDLQRRLAEAEKAATDSAEEVAFSQAASANATELEKELAAMTVAKERSDTDLKEAQDTNQALAEQNEALRTENAKMQGNVEAAQSWRDELQDSQNERQRLEDELAGLRTEQANYAGERGALVPQLEKLTAEQADLNERLATSQDIRRELREEIAQLKESNAAAQNEVGQLKGELAQLQSDSSANAEQLQALQEQLQAKEKQVDELQAELAVTTGKLLRTPTPSDWLHWDFSGDDSKNYAFVNDDGQIHLLKGAEGEWTHSNLSQTVEDKSGAPVIPAVSGCITGYAPAHCQHVIYTAEDNSLREMWSEEDEWHQENLTAKTGAPPVHGKPNAIYVQGRNVIVYPDATGDLQALSFSDEWYHRSIPGGEGANPNRGVHLKEDGDVVVLAWRDAAGDPKMLRWPIAELPG